VAARGKIRRIDSELEDEDKNPSPSNQRDGFLLAVDESQSRIQLLYLLMRLFFYPDPGEYHQMPNFDER